MKTILATQVVRRKTQFTYCIPYNNTDAPKKLSDNNQIRLDYSHEWLFLKNYGAYFSALINAIEEGDFYSTFPPLFRLHYNFRVRLVIKFLFSRTWDMIHYSKDPSCD